MGLERGIGVEAIEAKGWWRAYRYLLLRRLSQLSILGLFLLGPWFGVMWLKGNLSSSLVLDTVPLTDPLLLLQVLLTRHLPETTAVIGALIVLGFYLLVGGRVYCSWVCPVNMITDGAAWLQRKTGYKGSVRLDRSTRFWLLGTVLLLALLTGMLVWELVNPVSAVVRGLVFGMGFAWALVAGIFLFDLFVSHRGWCGHLCPMGAFYGLVGRFSPLRVGAYERRQCNDCMDCFAVCPEPQVIKPALKDKPAGHGPVIDNSMCTNCGRCIDVCSKDVFAYSLFAGRGSGKEIDKQQRGIVS